MPTQQFTRQTQGEGRLAGARGRGGEEVARAGTHAVRSVGGEVRLERFGLPRAEILRRSPGGALREGGRKVFGGEAAEVLLSSLVRPVHD